MTADNGKMAETKWAVLIRMSFPFY